MGDVVSSHLDEGKREMITVKTGDVMRQFSDVYKQQYAVALFNSIRYEIEGGGGPQSQLLHRKDPLAGRSIFSGNLFQYLEENRKWRNRFVSVPNNYTINLYESKSAHERTLHPKVTINCAGYKALTSIEDYMELINTSLPDVKAKSSSNPFIRCATPFPLILWHPYARHHYFCVMTEKEQQKWHAVLQDCVRHCNNGLPEDCTVQTPAFTDTVRLHRQAKGHYGTWDMMCGTPSQILANLVMESLHPEVRNAIGPRLKGKMQQRQRDWMFVSSRQIVPAQRKSENIVMLIIGTYSLLKRSVQPYINSILEALMEPISRGFAEVRDVFFREVVDISKNLLNGGDKEKLAEHLEKLSMLAFHPVKMKSCYDNVEELNLEGLQQRFDVSSPSVFVSRAQILMREQMDNAVHTFEQLLQQSLAAQGENDMCKIIQGCQDRVLKKYDYDSSTVRKKFFREALLQIIIPYFRFLPPEELPRFKELIFEDFSPFLLVENMFEEVVLQSVTKDIMMAVKEAAVQRRHNLYRDSIVMTNSDPDLQALGESLPVDWATKFGNGQPEGGSGDADGGSGKKRKQVVSMIQLEGVPLPYESCLEADACGGPKSPDSVDEIRDLINPVKEVVLPDEIESDMSNGTVPTPSGIPLGDGAQEEVSHVTTLVEDVPLKSPQEKRSPQSILQQLVGNKEQEDEKEEAAIKSAIEEIELAVQEGEREQTAEVSATKSDSSQQPALAKDSAPHEEPQPVKKSLNGDDSIIDPVEVEVVVA
uniref:Niban apoptosis regulator 2a n=1 Tax=Hippocampus comes TaxID=109280 RepID=A0A3Q2XD09_HIPCM